jgi:hypothetical protein
MTIRSVFRWLYTSTPSYTSEKFKFNLRNNYFSSTFFAPLGRPVAELLETVNFVHSGFHSVITIGGSGEPAMP